MGHILNEHDIAVPRRAVRDSLARLDHLRKPPRKIKRRSWFNGVGKDTIWSMDHNEKLKKWGISIFAAIETHTRSGSRARASRPAPSRVVVTCSLVATLAQIRHRCEGHDE